MPGRRPPLVEERPDAVEEWVPPGLGGFVALEVLEPQMLGLHVAGQPGDNVVEFLHDRLELADDLAARADHSQARSRRRIDRPQVAGCRLGAQCQSSESGQVA